MEVIDSEGNKEELTTDEELNEKLMKNCLPIVKRKNLLQDSYCLYDQHNFVNMPFITKLNKLLPIYGSLTYFDGKK